ncbi:uncharacterized protein LOC115509383 [Lynx canadensis]|uniref:uncharacterized protein LOC115509383 n=1 Tax=Lynx canadensis TaxID=61383 RepID=UPI0011B02892|nr:uncharacterized protein LOC115509383 [Lynx canadensis]
MPPASLGGRLPGRLLGAGCPARRGAGRGGRRRGRRGGTAGPAGRPGRRRSAGARWRDAGLRDRPEVRAAHAADWAHNPGLERDRVPETSACLMGPCGQRQCAGSVAPRPLWAGGLWGLRKVGFMLHLESTGPLDRKAVVRAQRERPVWDPAWSATRTRIGASRPKTTIPPPEAWCERRGASVNRRERPRVRGGAGRYSLCESRRPRPRNGDLLRHLGRDQNF